jgi:hypothetical protein
MTHRWFLGTPPRTPIPGTEGVYVHVGSKVHTVVAFLGHADPTSGAGIHCEGTGFFVHYKDAGYLITARHVAEKVDAGPFVIRINRWKGGAELLEVLHPKWHFPTDRSVDLAAHYYSLPRDKGYDVNYLNDEIFLTNKLIDELDVDVGDQCYTVGLFRYLFGDKRNFPLVHTGNIALMPPPGERIPVGNQHVEGFLIESRAIDGSSGSPVFVRAAFRVENVKYGLEGKKREPIFSEGRIRLLGLFQGAWFLPPDAILAASGMKQKPGDVVPVGIGVVIPTAKILELLEEDTVKAERATKKPVPKIVAARPTATGGEGEGETSRREDFNRLLSAAVKRPKSSD